MKRIIALILVLSMLSLVGCGDKSDDTATIGAYANKQEYLGTYSDEITTINYLVTSTTLEFGLAANFVDTLVDYDRYGVLRPCLATDWSVSEDGLVWTFNIRKGVNWYDSEGKEYSEVTAQDFVDSLEYIFNQENGSKTANIAYRVIKNAESYYNKEITDFSKVGVKAVDKYKLEYTLEKAVPYFESMLTYSCFFPVNGKFLKQQGNRFGTSNTSILYNGAYIMETFEPQNRRILIANENYWDKDNVFIKKIKYKYNKEANTLAQELYNRGEISQVAIPSASIDAWMNDPKSKDKVRPALPSFYTYFYALNFDPNFDAQYEPENWRKAVNNKNFRKAFFHGLDRIAAMTTAEPYSPENKINNTVTPKSFVAVGGKDYTQMGELAQITARDSFDETKAVEFKKKAMDDLKGSVTFPVKVMMPYNTGGSEASQRAQIVEQQLERTLGTDFVDVMIVPFPPSGYLGATRRAGNYALQEVNWGPDYADPETYTDMFVVGSTYNFPEKCTEINENNKKTFDVYIELVNNAKDEIVDIEKRYNLFAQAEAYLINEAWIIPYGVGGGGYISSLLNPFEAPYSPFGVSSERWKGQRILAKPMNTEDYNNEKTKWQKERKEALEKASK
ncbi:peptide ABC transporter substrate-binding protein [Clostridiaceae bacterium M8S5]|nr:peptide ABC transporter substrate-binding protein [Clostridiaceae bacterium M8S5]